MGKKCIPGVICVENMTLFLMFIIVVLIAYLGYTQIIKPRTVERDSIDRSAVVIVQSPPTLATISARRDPFNDPYAPPLKYDGLFYPQDGGDIRGGLLPLNSGMIPINMETRGLSTGYQQVGILTRTTGQSDMILPLMGRRNMAGRDKWQYYTISNSGTLNTKLPVSVNGKSCTSEYGCDSIYNGDVVYVEGYGDTFRATIYENNLFRYIP